MPLTWRDAAGYFERLEEARPAVNVASLVPNGQLRLAAVGLEDRPASREERAAMRVLLEESLEQGAWGYSTGLEYAAERAAPQDELGRSARCCARRGGLYATHTRRRDAGSDEAVDEAVETARAQRGPAAGVPPRPAERRRRDARAASSSSSGQPGAGSTSRSTCTRASSARRFSRRALPPAFLTRRRDRE